MRSAVLIAVVAAGLLAIPPAAAAEPGDVALTDAQTEDFREAAAAAGLSRAEIDAALADPTLLAATPVFVESEEPVVSEVVAMPRQPGPAGTLTHTAIRGRVRSKTLTYRTFWGTRLFSFTMSKYWEYDGRRVVSAPSPRTYGNVTSYGAFVGWDYDGIVSRGDWYFTHDGRWHGGHESYRQAKFTHCAFNVGCVWKKYPRITIRGYYDGTSAAWGR